MSTGRMRRVDEAIRQVIGDVVGDLKDPRVGFVTVTDVRTSADLRHARVYVSVLGADGQPSEAEERESSLEGLRSAHGFLQGRLAAELRLKRTPALEFHLRRDHRPGDARGVPNRRDGALVSELATLEQTRELVLARIREDEHFVLATHENPDGDALGSLVAMQGLLSALGKDTIMFISPHDLPLPHEYALFDLTGLIKEPPGDIAGRTVVFLDCGNIDRNSASVLRDGAHLLNIDHHHDNTRFGTLNHVVPDASCTAEIVWDLMHGLGVQPTREVAEALYVGLITDTGRFMYENVGPRAHLMAAELLEAGVDVPAINRRLYEDMPQAKLTLLALALGKVQRFDSGELALVALTAADFDRTGAEESHSEGIIDQLRALQGTKVAALVRELSSGERKGQHKVSLRSTDDDVDVSIIARAQGGGGHRRAAGFSTTLAADELIVFLRAAIADQLHKSADGQPATVA